MSFEVSPEQQDVHVLPQFTMVEILASVGGILFFGYLAGSLVFPFFSTFYLENQIMGMIFKGTAGTDRKLERKGRPPWGSIAGQAKIADFPADDVESARPAEHRISSHSQNADLYEGGQRAALRERESIRPDKAYCCFGLLCLRNCRSRQGIAAQIGKKKLTRHLELSRILNRLVNTKTAIELMLMPNEKGLEKAKKKLFQVSTAADDYFSDSSSEEEQLIAIALENA